jgi:hypothetical protein
MRLFDTKTLKATLDDIELDSSDFYLSKNNLESTRELMLMILNFDQLSGLLVLMYEQKHKYVNLSELIKGIFEVIEAINTLAYEYHKNNCKRHSSRTVYYNFSDKSKLKQELGALDEEIMAKTNLQKHADDYIPEALVLIIGELRMF